MDDLATGVLAVALRDAENTNRLCEMPDETRAAFIARAEQVRRWLRIHGFDVEPQVTAALFAARQEAALLTRSTAP